VSQAKEIWVAILLVETQALAVEAVQGLLVSDTRALLAALAVQDFVLP
jgi:hypothetical protein